MVTGIITPTTEGQEKQFNDLWEAAKIRARREVVLGKDSMQRFLGNGDKFQEDIIASLSKRSVVDDRFGLLKSFQLTVPKGYTHGTQLATFAEYAKDKSQKFYYYNEAITDENYAKVTHQLVPGKTCGVKIFGINKSVSSEEDCLVFLASQNAILVGAQGISLTRQLKKDEFPIGKWTVSFDKKEALWRDGFGNHRVPGIGRISDGGWHFGLGDFGLDWDDGLCLLCFCDF
jgi:hypothetical protein